MRDYLTYLVLAALISLMVYWSVDKPSTGLVIGLVIGSVLIPAYVAFSKEDVNSPQAREKRKQKILWSGVAHRLDDREPIKMSDHLK